MSDVETSGQPAPKVQPTRDGDLFAEVIVVGSDLLRGDVGDSSAQIVAGLLTARGARVRSITFVADDEQTIAAALRNSLELAPHFVVTIGGLGPAADDRTLAGVSEALKLPLTPQLRRHRARRRCVCQIERAATCRQRRHQRCARQDDATPDRLHRAAQHGRDRSRDVVPSTRNHRGGQRARFAARSACGVRGGAPPPQRFRNGPDRRSTRDRNVHSRRVGACSLDPWSRRRIPRRSVFDSTRGFAKERVPVAGEH